LAVEVEVLHHFRRWVQLPGAAPPVVSAALVVLVDQVAADVLAIRKQLAVTVYLDKVIPEPQQQAAPDLHMGRALAVAVALAVRRQAPQARPEYLYHGPVAIAAVAAA
jgi:hypothetical protein